MIKRFCMTSQKLNGGRIDLVPTEEVSVYTMLLYVLYYTMLFRFLL